jgi:AraC-like DNA-binding protein
MPILDQFLLLLSGLGGSHGLLLAMYFFFRQPGCWSNRFLGAVVLMLSIRVLKSVLFYFNPAIGKQILQVGLSACFLIGPLLYCYSLQYLGRFQQSAIYRLHLIIPVLLVFVVGVVFPYHLYVQLWGGVFYKLINYIWLAYTLLSFYVLWPKISSLNISNWRKEIDFVIVLGIVAGSGLVWAAYFFAAYTSYISGALTFTFLMCIGIMTVFIHVQKQKSSAPAPYANKKIADQDAQPLITELEQFVISQKVFLDANLALPKLAKSLGWSTPKLSQLLNDNLNQSFNDFINSYRIDYASTLLTSNSVMKMDDLAAHSGFNSLSTFYTAFKKHTQLTPAKYKALYGSQSS